MAVRTLLSIGISLGFLTASIDRFALAEPAAAAKPAAAEKPTVLPSSAGLEAGVSRLLQLGENYSPRALADVRKQHESLSRLPGYDVRVQYAYALVLIRQRSTDDAVRVLGEVLVKEPESLPAWRAKIWTEMSARKYREAIDDMRATAAVVEKQEKKSKRAKQELSPEAIEEQRATAYFLGRSFSFLERARGTALPAGDLRRSKQNIMSKLGEQRAAFAEGEEAIAEDLSDAAAELKKAEEADTAVREQKEHELKQQQQAVDKAEAKVDLESEKLKAQVQKQLEQLDKEAQRIQKNILKSQFDLNTVDQAIGVMQQQQAIQNLNPQGQFRFPGQLIAIQNNLQRLFAQRLLVVGQLAEANSQMNEVVMRRNAMLGEGAQTNEELQARSQHLRHEEKKLHYAEKTRPKGNQVDSPQSRALKQQKQAFRTYEPFPFEQEKQRVLTSLQEG